MNEETEAKIESAAQACLGECDGLTPFEEVARFIDKLNMDSTWTATDIAEVKYRVIGVILYRPKNSPPSNN